MTPGILFCFFVISPCLLTPAASSLKIAASPSTDVVTFLASTAIAKGGSGGGNGQTCVPGTFHKHEEAFGSREARDFLANLLGIIIECTSGLVTTLTANLVNACYCDCVIYHGASDGRACNVLQPSSDTYSQPCKCIYSYEDKEKYACFKPANRPDNRRRPLLPLQNNATETTTTTSLRLGRSKPDCSALLPGVELVRDISCTDQTHEFKYKDEVFLLDGRDICELDCYIAHGITKSPYGVCDYFPDGKVICLCLTDEFV